MPGQRSALPQSEKPQGLFEEHHSPIPRPSLRLADSGVMDCETQRPLFTIATKIHRILCLSFGVSAQDSLLVETAAVVEVVVAAAAMVVQDEGVASKVMPLIERS